MPSSPNPEAPTRLADLTLHDCPLNHVTLDFAAAALRLHISQYHEARQVYVDYELIFRGVAALGWTELRDFPYGYEQEITSYSEQEEAGRLRLRFGLLTGSGGPYQELTFSCAGYKVRPADR